MERSIMEGISDRLASLDSLYFPGAMHRQAPDTAQRKTALLDLLSRDAPIFLERYGVELTPDELREFENLRQDYEVDWHLERLRSRQNPTAEDARARSLTIKNRRRAYMERLLQDGEYFSEDAMREREPYLHHEYLGKFQDPAGRCLSRPGERWSETLMRRCEEAILVEKIRGEQQRLGIDRKEWIGAGAAEQGETYTEEEDEEEDDDDVDDESNDMVKEEYKVGVVEHGKIQSNLEKEIDKDDDHDDDVTMVGTGDKFGEFEEGNIKSISLKMDDKDASNNTTQASDGSPYELSREEMQDQLEQFTHIMQQKFLAGEDTAYLDYSLIDNDERLDDHWLKEVNYDAEEKYFEED